jgi:hypothetical protein
MDREKQRRKGKSERSHLKEETENFHALKVARLVAKVGFREGRALVNKVGKVMGRGFCYERRKEIEHGFYCGIIILMCATNTHRTAKNLFSRTTRRHTFGLRQKK